ncbi:hypothetical protein LTR67_003243 [Exophiala xenobiotica]
MARMGLTERLSFSWLAVVGGLASLGLAYWVVSVFLSYRKLRHIKGPWLASISPLWLFYYTCRGTLYLAVEDALKKYGSPVRIGPDYIVTDDPVIQKYMAAPRSPFVRGRWFKGMKFDTRKDNVLSMSDEKAHAELRAKLMPGYTGNEVPTLESDIDARVGELLDLIQRDLCGEE